MDDVVERCRRARRPVLLGLLALVAACGGGGDRGEEGGDRPSVTIGRDGSTVVEDVDAVAVGEPVHAYSISYRVEEVDGDEVRITGAELAVVRPYQSRLDILDADGELVSRRVADFAYLTEQPGAGVTSRFQAVPSTAPGDIRGDLVVASATSVGEVRRIVGRACQVHMFGGPLAQGQVLDGDTTESCIDADGLLLEEIVRDDARIVSRWVATDVDTSPPLDDDDFVVADAETIGAEAGGGSVQEVVPTSRSLGTFFELTGPPTGFEHRGRYAVVPPQVASADDPKSRAEVTAGVVDVYERGDDVVVIDQGGTLGKVPAFGAAVNGSLVDDLGELGSLGESFPTPAGGEVRVLIPPGRYVRVYGSLPVDELLAIARSLRGIEGTGLVYP